MFLLINEPKNFQLAWLSSVIKFLVKLVVESQTRKHVYKYGDMYGPLFNPFIILQDIDNR